MSELFPHLAQQADWLCVVRSVHTEGTAHGEALLRLHTGEANLVRPSVGAWVSYGLGPDNDNLPAFITISPPRGHGGVQNYGNAFLPGNPSSDGHRVGRDPDREGGDSESRQYTARSSLAAKPARPRPVAQPEPSARCRCRPGDRRIDRKLRTRVPHAVDHARDHESRDESKATLDLYGVGAEPTDNFGRQCLLARKFAERGVRFIQVSTDDTWDHHKVEKGHIAEAAKVDRPIAALLDDLDQRGLLEDTLVLWGGEFGRTPMAENADGRGHHPKAFTMWMAGGGVRPGLTYGATDDFGFHPVENPVHMHDLHATLLYALGLDHERLTFRYAGRDFRLTDVYGKVVHGLLGA